MFTRSRDSQSLVSAHHNRGRWSPKNFKDGHLNFGLKFRVCIYAYNFGASGFNLTKLYQAMYQEAAVITWVQLLEEVPKQNLGRQKTWKIRRDFGQLSTLIANISGMDRHNENPKTAFSSTSPIGRKNWWTLDDYQKSYRRQCRPTEVDFFRKLLYISAVMGCCRLKFLHMLQHSKFYFQSDLGAGRPQVGLYPTCLVQFNFPRCWYIKNCSMRG